MTGNRYLVFTTFISGAIVMVIELLGSRIIGPPFGVSLFVWTSLITVTLVSLAFGYWIGGKLSETRNSHSALFMIIFLAGFYLLLIPVMKGLVIEGALSFGLRAGSLVSSTALFAPPLFLLGMVTPYTVKLYMAEKTEGVGKTVGRLYAISTAGSFIGTVSTGFLLIPNLGVNNIIYLSSFTLIGLTALYWAFFRGKFHFLIAWIVPAMLFFYPKELPSITRPDGTVVSVLASEDSPYGQIKVVDYSFGGEHLREFLLDNMIQSGIDVNTGLSITRYTYYIENLARAYYGDAKRALVIGLGAGIIPSRLSSIYGIKTDVVEINPGVVETAERYFAFDPQKNPTSIEDGRVFLKSDGEPYDIIVLDAFSGDTPPSHLISLEAFKLVKERLSENGVLLINFVGSNQKNDMEVPSSLQKTLKEVFPFVDIYVPDYFTTPEPIVVNLTFAAYLKERDVKMPPTLPAVYPSLKKDTEGILSRKISLENGRFLFTDDFNPIDFQDLKTREKFRMSTITSSDTEIVID